MEEVYDTVGNVVRDLATQCDCGLTGGCEKCRPPSTELQVKFIFPKKEVKKREDYNTKRFRRRT